MEKKNKTDPKIVNRPLTAIPISNSMKFGRNISARAHDDNSTKFMNQSAQGQTKINPPLSSRIPLQKNTLGNTPADKHFTLPKKTRTSLDMKSKKHNCVDTESFKTVNNSPRSTTNSISAASITSIPHRRPSDTTSISTITITAGGTAYRPKERIFNETALISKQKQFDLMKKRLTDLQTDFLKTYKTLKEIRSKSKSTEKDLIPNEIKLIAITDVDCNKSQFLIKNPTELLFENSPSSCEVPFLNLTNTHSKSPRSLFDSSEIIDIKSELFTITECGFKLCQEFSNNLRSFFDDMEFKQAGDGKNDYQKQLSEFMYSLESKIPNVLKEQQNHLNSVLRELEKYITPKSTDENFLKIKNEYEEQISKLNLENEELKKNLEISQTKINEKPPLDTNEIQEMRNEIITLKKTVIDKDSEIAKKSNSSKEHETKINNLEKQLKTISKSNDEKSSIFRKLEIELKNKVEREKIDQNTIKELRKQQNSYLEKVQKEKDTLKKLENDKKSLENELQEKIKEIQTLKTELDKQKFTYLSGGGDRSSLEHALSEDFNKLKKKYETLLKEKNEIEKERNEFKKISYEKSNLELECCKSNQEISQLENTNECLRGRIEQLEQTINKKNSVVNELEQKISTGIYLAESSNRETIDELNKLREVEKHKQQEIDSLKKQLSKNQLTLKQQQETIFMNQRLLKIRCELINSLQEKEQYNRARLQDLSPELNKNSTLIDQMNHELSAKAEELQNLFSTLGSKQLELSKQKHMIKLLENNNDKLQKIRVKHELKIAKQDQEIRQLKEAINIKFGTNEFRNS